ncbi:MAG: AbrB/MazE/SpoVT family DNA-binding domain-containing protein [Desulfobacteraceae bacterium]|jgi:AbrB family looped-hinge helix DNA binding protein
MMNMNLIKMSSKGQIVIPSCMRQGLREGEEFIIIKDDERFVLKKAKSLTDQMKEDLEFARRTEEALQRYDRGEFISMDGEEFIQEINKW